MNNISPLEPISLSPDLIARLDLIACRDIAKHLILDGSPENAWRLLTLAGKRSELYEVLDGLDRHSDYFGHGKQSLGLLTAPLGALVGQGLAADLHDNPNLRQSDLGLRLSSWLSQGDEFIKGLRETMGPASLLMAAQSMFAHSLLMASQSMFEHSHWFQAADPFNYAAAFRQIEGLGRAYSEAAINFAAANPQHGNAAGVAPRRHGFSGLVGLAATGHLPAMREALGLLAEKGKDVAACLAQRWPNESQKRLPPPLQENNALGQALISLDRGMVQLILSKAPKLRAVSEAKRAMRIAHSQCQHEPPKMQAHLRDLASGALALAESLVLEQIPSAPSRHARSGL